MSTFPQIIFALAFRQDAKSAWVELVYSHHVQDVKENDKAVKAVKNFIESGLARIQVKDLTVFDSSEYWQQIIAGHKDIVNSLRDYLAKELADLVPDSHELTMDEFSIYRDYIDNVPCIIEDYEVNTRKIIK